MLTTMQVKAASPRAKSYKLADARGLYLFVSTTGTKSWRFKYRREGKEKLLTFGQFPEVTIVEARDWREVAKRALKEGNDPAIVIKARRRQPIMVADVTFEMVARQWLADHEVHWSRANATRVRNRIERDLLDVLGDVPVRNISSTLILKQLRKIEQRGSIETAKRVRGYILAILKRARGEKLISSDIIEDVGFLADALKPNPPSSKLPALTNVTDLLAFQKTVDRSMAPVLVKLASRFLALTLVRISALRFATWSEFQGIDWEDPEKPVDKAIWYIPAAHMKLAAANKRNPNFGHSIPLSSQAVDVLRAIHEITGGYHLAFPRPTVWYEPMSDCTLSTLYKRMADGRYKGKMVPHGWRSAFSTIMNERAALLERDGDRLMIDMILAHVPKGVSGSEWAYNRARYFGPKAALCQTWADMITKGLCPPDALLDIYREEGRWR